MTFSSCAVLCRACARDRSLRQELREGAALGDDVPRAASCTRARELAVGDDRAGRLAGRRAARRLERDRERRVARDGRRGLAGTVRRTGCPGSIRPSECGWSPGGISHSSKAR